MSNEKFCLRWNDFENNISNAFKELRDDKNFFDVTLACDDEQIQAHKVILAACSPFFRNILRRNHHQHPLLYMKGVKYTDLQAVLNFMYHGEVNVAQEELNSFLAVAEDLRVKGLTQSLPPPPPQQSSSDQPSRCPTPPAPAPPRTKHRPPEREPTQLQLPKRTPHLSEDIQEIVPIKSEPLTEPPHQVYSTAADHTVSTYQEDAGYEDYGDYQDQGYSEIDNTMDHNISMQGGLHGKGGEPDRSILHEYIKKELINGRSLCVCTMCGKSNSQKQNLMNHVESVHFPNMFTYNCKYCGKTYNAKNSLYVHMSTSHRDQKSSF